MPKRVLIAYDGSLLSRKAIEEGKKMAANNTNIEVHIVSVIESSGPKANAAISRNINNELMEKFRPQIKLVKEEFESAHIPVVTDLLLEEGNRNPSTLICKYAKDNEIDLIIVGSRGLGKVKNILLGSVSNGVLEKSECPVLVMK